MKRFTLLLLISLLSCLAFSQKLSVYMADKQYEQFNYAKAIEFYENSLEKDSTNAHVFRNLGQSYYKINKYESATKYFEILMKNPDRKDDDLMLYGEIAKELGDYSRSETLLKAYLVLHPSNTKILALIKDLKISQSTDLSSLICKIDTLPINSKFSDFAPVIYKDKLIFSSARKSKRFRNDVYGWDGQYFLELFQCTRKDTLKQGVKRFARSIGSKYHEAVLCFSPDFKTMYFTRSNYNHGKLKRDKKGISNLKIFIAEDLKGKWKITKEFPFNSDEFSVGHPSLSANGKTLYFVSDMPGGYGETDIYLSRLKNGEWTKPQNLGADINSPQNEMFPYIKNQTLFFASNGHSGLGGLDLYMVKNISKNKKPIHLGKPLNSKQDDFSLILSDNGAKGYFASNRNGGLGDDDIYSFEISRKNEIEFELRHIETEELLKADQVFANGSLDTDFNFDINPTGIKR